MEWSGNLDQRISSLPVRARVNGWTKGDRSPERPKSERRSRRHGSPGPGSGKRRGDDPCHCDVNFLAASEMSAKRRGAASPTLKSACSTTRGGTRTEKRRLGSIAIPKRLRRSNRSSRATSAWAATLIPRLACMRMLTALGGSCRAGISEGMPVHEAYAAQWGSMSRALGLDAIMLRVFLWNAGPKPAGRPVGASGSPPGTHPPGHRCSSGAGAGDKTGKS